MKPFLGLLIAFVFSPLCQAGEIDFDTQVRPILSDHCFPCHGPDESKREGDLRLDTSAGAKADLGGYAAFLSNDPDNSEGLRRILSEDEDEMMPPPSSKLKLSDAQKSVLQAWVNEGANWSEHWSFAPPTMPNVPQDETGWSHGEIDRFVIRKAHAAGKDVGAANRKEYGLEPKQAATPAAKPN